MFRHQPGNFPHTAGKHLKTMIPIIGRIDPDFAMQPGNPVGPRKYPQIDHNVIPAHGFNILDRPPPAIGFPDPDISRLVRSA